MYKSDAFTIGFRILRNLELLSIFKGMLLTINSAIKNLIIMTH